MSNPNKLPISQLAILSSMVIGIFENTELQKQQFLEIVGKPHVLDDATVQRSQRLYQNQLEDIHFYEMQANDWLSNELTTNQESIIKTMLRQIKQIRLSSQTILDLLSEIEKGTINRIMAMSDEELGIHHLQRQAQNRKKKDKKKSNMQRRKKSVATETNEPNKQHLRLAKKIHEWVMSIQKAGGGPEEMMMSMIDYMPSFKKIMDTATSQQIDTLCEQYLGFYQFALLLEDLARGIQNGDIEVPND